MSSTGFLRGENIHVMPTGEEVYVESSVSVLLDWAGAPAGWLAVMRDVTERKTFERKLKESEERYRSLVESSPDAMFVSQNGKLVYVNPATLKLIGAKDANQLLGQETVAFVHFDVRERAEQRLRDAEERGGRALSRESVVRAYRRKYCPRRIRRHPDQFQRQAGGPGYREGHHGTKGIRGNAAQLGTALSHDVREQSPSHVDLRYGHPSFLFVNDAAIVRYGYSKEEFLSMTLKDIRPAEDMNVLMDNVSKIAAGLYDSGSWKHRKKDGTVIDVEIISHNLKVDGKDARVVLAHDITDRRKAEAALRESEERQRAVFDNSPMAIFAKDLQGRFIMFNRQAELWLSRQRDEVIGKTDYDLFPKETADRLRVSDRKVTETGHRWKQKSSYPVRRFGTNSPRHQIPLV